MTDSFDYTAMEGDGVKPTVKILTTDEMMEAIDNCFTAQVSGSKRESVETVTAIRLAYTQLYDSHAKLIRTGWALLTAPSNADWMQEEAFGEVVAKAKAITP